MRGIDSLKGRIALGSGALFLLLYAAAFAIVLSVDSRNRQSELELVLYAQSESLASYYASTGRLDFPELYSFESKAPVPVWMRVVRDGHAMAATPGLPNLPLPTRAARKEDLEVWSRPGQEPLAVVRHDVWNHPGVMVEAVAPLEVLEHRRRELTLVLSLTGLLLIPLAAFGGRLLAINALRPVDRLVASIGTLGTDRLDQRLEAPGAVAEITHLTDEFNRLLDRLEESVASMQRFTADASHELRTPISILRTGLEVTLRRDRTTEEYRELLRENLVEIERVQRIVEGLLTLARARPGAGQPADLPAEVVDFSGVVQSAVESIRQVADERRIELRSHVTPQALVAGDQDRLRLMVLNLLDNAAKFTPSGRSVEVTLDGTPETVRFEVHDEGPGVGPEDRRHIFDRFFRGRGPHASGASAGGLGLSVVRWVAEIHGGQVRLVEDDRPGATFEVLLPRAAGEAAPPLPLA
jgi:two-component system OmpR family sensor kinase